MSRQTIIRIEDEMNGINAVVVQGGGYNPDILDDMQRRCIKTYKQALKQRILLCGLEVETPEPDEPESGMDAAL